MKLHADDPRLTAYILGEGTPEENAAIEHVAETDEKLAQAIEELKGLSTELYGVFGKEENTLTARNRENILRSARQAANAGKIVSLESHPKAKNPWLLPLGAAAVIGGGLFLLTMNPAKQSDQALAASKMESVSPEEADAVKISQLEGLSKLPLEAGKRSLTQISSAVRIEGRLPEKREVRIEELLNAFPLKAKGAAALWKDCQLTAEIMPCPWKSSANLVIISLQGARDAEREISLEFRANEAGLSSYRLLGYSNGKPMKEVASSKKIKAGDGIVLVMETIGNGRELGELLWTVDGSEGPNLHLVHEASREPSSDAAFAALVTAVGLWLRDEEKPAMDQEVVRGLAREVAASSLVPDRYDFLYLVEQIMKLKDGDAE